MEGEAVYPPVGEGELVGMGLGRISGSCVVGDRVGGGIMEEGR